MALHLEDQATSVLALDDDRIVNGRQVAGREVNLHDDAMDGANASSVCRRRFRWSGGG